MGLKVIHGARSLIFLNSNLEIYEINTCDQ